MSNTPSNCDRFLLAGRSDDEDDGAWEAAAESAICLDLMRDLTVLTAEGLGWRCCCDFEWSCFLACDEDVGAEPALWRTIKKKLLNIFLKT